MLLQKSLPSLKNKSVQHFCKIDPTTSRFNNTRYCDNIALFKIEHSVKQGKPSLRTFKASMKGCWVKTNLHWLAYFFTVTLSVAPLLMRSSSAWQLNLYYLQEDWIKLYSAKLKMFFTFFISLIRFSYDFLKFFLILFCYFLLLPISKMS